MQLDFTADQEELRASVRSVLERECPISLVRALVEKGTRPDGLWEQMVALDWPALTIPETAGGIGLGAVELAVLAEELGRVIAPGPLLPTISQLVPAIIEAGTAEQQERFLGAVARGELTGTLAVADAESGRGGWTPESITATAEPAGDGGWALRGTKRWVIEGGFTDEVVVAARSSDTSGTDGIGLFVIPTSDLSPQPVTSFDGSRTLAHLPLDGIVVAPDRVLGGEPGAAGPALRRALEVATVALALEMVGTCQTIFDVTLAYAKEREQFGVPIGSFQAIKHKLADMLVDLERARATAYFAAAAIAEEDERRSVAASMAKATAGDCQRRLVKEGIQIHGGIGFMWEHDIQLYAKRAKAGELLFGGANEHRARVADLIGV